MKTNNNILKMMMTSLSVALIAALVFTDGISAAVRTSEYKTDRVNGGCGSESDDTPEMKDIALRAIDAAIYDVAKGYPNTCSQGPDSKIFASANCTTTLPMDDCKLCLYNAQYRVVEKECPKLFGGWLLLTDCYVSYGNSTSPSCAF